jgi:hypothetical protein
MKPNVTFEKALIAPCGMNCGTCIAYLRPKNKCPGCRMQSEKKSTARTMCIVKTCINLEKSSTGFCYECEKFPCRRIKQLDKRYSTKYNTSFIGNLTTIREKGIDSFLRVEAIRRSCKVCGAVLSVHRDKCLVCGKEVPKPGSN